MILNRFKKSAISLAFPARKLLLLLLLPLLALLTLSAAPTLTPKDTRVKMEEILAAHATSPQMTPELLKRVYQSYLNEIDPSKTYLLKSEVEKWENASAEELEKGVKQLKKEDFSSFDEIRKIMKDAISRRAALEKRLSSDKMPKNVELSEFKEISWAQSEEELYTRLLRIRSIQLETTNKLGKEELKTQFISHMQKRRERREAEFLTSGKEGDRHNLALTLKAIAASLDSHTTYFTPTEASQFMIQVQQRLFGIGAQLRDDFTGLTVMQIIEGSPASKSEKLKPMDKIIAVDGTPIIGMDIAEAVELIRGAEGSICHLTVLRESPGSEKSEETLNIDITRGEIVFKEARFTSSFEPFADGVIAHLHLHSFYQDSNSSSASDLKNALEELKAKHKLKGVVLDLRNNGGGLLPQAVEVVSLFIKKGIVVSVKDNTGKVQHLRNTDGNPTWDGPLVVLTNRASASASEIVAQSLQDYGRAIIAGDTRTYGKGSFQTFTLEATQFGKVDPKGEYKVTRGRYYTVSGKSPQLTGVTADIEVPGYFSKLDIGEEFAKHPLSCDALPPNFDDDLSDVPLISRNQVRRMYKFDLQPVLTTYKPYLEKVKANSKLRIENNKTYQNFLKLISQENFDNEGLEKFSQNDLQYYEAMNIIKDLIYLMQKNESSKY